MDPKPDQQFVPTLIITGPIGAGKTRVSHAIADRLRAAGVAHAMIDIDAIVEFSPHPPDDRWNFRLAMKNLAALWRNFREAGATHLVLNWVVESRDELAEYRKAIPGARITVVRLRAPVAVLEERIRRRATDPDLTWEIARSRELAEQMDATNLQDVLIATEGLSVDEVAAEILRRVGWPGKGGSGLQARAFGLSAGGGTSPGTGPRTPRTGPSDPARA